MRVFRNRGDGTFRGPHERGRPHRRDRGLEPRPGRLRQRRLRRRARAARRLDGDGGTIPAVAAAQQRRRHLHRRDRATRGCSRFAPTQTATWFDFDGDGWLDLFVGNESAPEGSDPEAVLRCELFRNNGDGTFTNVAREAGVDVVGLRQGRGQRRLRQRRPPRPLRLRPGGRQPAVAQRRPGAGRRRELALHRRRGRRRASPSPTTASRPCSSTTTTTAGSTSSSPATVRTVAGDVAADYLGLPHTGRPRPALSQPAATAPSRT